MHLTGDGTAMGARSPVCGDELGVRFQLVEIFGDGKRVPTLTPSWVRQGTRNDGDSRRSSARVAGSSLFANSRPIEWFERNLIATVPMRYPGAFRRVYPGFVQLAAFMSMNIERHVKAHRELYDNLANGEHDKAQVTKAFYDEYFAVLDLTAEFYLETVRLVFQEYALPTGKLEWQGERVDPRAIRRTMLRFRYPTRSSPFFSSD
jgi:hypothetical protein